MKKIESVYTLTFIPILLILWNTVESNRIILGNTFANVAIYLLLFIAFLTIFSVIKKILSEKYKERLSNYATLRIPMTHSDKQDFLLLLFKQCKTQKDIDYFIKHYKRFDKKYIKELSAHWTTHGRTDNIKFQRELYIDNKESVPFEPHCLIYICPKCGRVEKSKDPITNCPTCGHQYKNLKKVETAFIMGPQR